ncbi:apoptosis-associated speck-like protein containing a CARD isoform X1 [Ctenopharyngodon idella]|uniref:apoptosis-associated speck-like protein containing a CARD isoform X1 n=1 Tax=Ctenopharyngodon idella TaxID=7959 RepID=UPI002230AC0D|nr:apoptosis-associated speck-like protein containing a CARD isoform X1 [Ctenopharyngodon idella]
MSENILEREPCKEAKFVDDKRAELIQRVTSVMPIADELKSKNMLHGEKYDEIRKKETNQDKMRTLFESLKSGDTVKIAFYELLEKHEPPLFKELGGVSRKRKLADPESPVPYKRLNTGSNEQDNLNFNNASTSAQRPAQTTVYNIVNESPPSYNMENIRNSTVPKTEWKPVKPPALKKEKKPPAPKKEKKPPTPKKEKKPPAPKKVKKPPTPKKEKKPPAPKKVKKPPTPKKEKKPPTPKKEKKPPAPKKVKKPPTPKKEKKPPTPKKEKKPPAPKKVKKPPTPKKEKKPPAPKKVKKPPTPKKEKKPPAPKKVKKPAGRK